MPVVDSFEVVDAKVCEGERRPGHQLLHCACDEDFARACFGGDPRGRVDRDSNQLSICLFALARVQACAHLDEGPGGPAAVIPGEHHVRMNMYIAQVANGQFQVVEELGAIDPQERRVSVPALAS